MASGVRDLKVWQEAVALAGEVLRLIRQVARRETRATTDAIATTAMAVATHVAEGHGRYTAPEQRVLYHEAKRDLLRLETQLAILRHADLVSVSTHNDLLRRIHAVARLLAGYLVYLERQCTSDPDESPAPRDATPAPSVN